MPTVIAKDNEPFDILLKRFKKKCERAAILSEIKKHQAYEKPSVKKKREEKGLIDKVSATIILQNFLEQKQK